MINRALAATLLVALTTTTTLAATGPLGGPPPAAASGPATNTGGEVDSPGEPFRPQFRSPFMVTETFSMSCGVGEGKFKNGGSIIKLVNTSSKTIPKGAKVEVTYPNGSTETFIAPSDIGPGAYLSIVGPKDATPETYSCSASATGKVHAEQPSPSVGGAASGDPTIPPQLVCWVEVVDGKVVIYWQNKGGSAVPAGTEVKGKNAAGIGVSVWITNPIDPGETKSLVLDYDPSLAVGDCKASFVIPH